MSFCSLFSKCDILVNLLLKLGLRQYIKTLTFKLHYFPAKISREWTLSMLQTELPKLSCRWENLKSVEMLFQNIPGNTFRKDALECFCLPQQGYFPSNFLFLLNYCLRTETKFRCALFSRILSPLALS